jgi:hypothetical protein
VKTVSIENVKRSPRIRNVKTTLTRSEYLLIEADEFQNCMYNVCVLIVLDMTRDHLLRFLADKIKLPEGLKECIKPFTRVRAFVEGFAYGKEIEEKGKLFKARS